MILAIISSILPKSFPEPNNNRCRGVLYIHEKLDWQLYVTHFNCYSIEHQALNKKP